MRFSMQEVRDLLIAWLVVSLAFGIALSDKADLVTMIWVSALTVGVGFIFHELGHKFTAQHYGKFAEFKASYPMLFVAVVLSFTGVVIAAPGAVMISGFINRKEGGMIASAGPLTNIAIAIIILPLYFIFGSVNHTLSLLLGFGFMINAWLALFNMIPFGIFDGAKIISWNKFIYAAMVLLSVILMFFTALVQGA